MLTRPRPIGAVSVLIVVFILRLPLPEKHDLPLIEKLKNLDPLGNLFFAPSIISLLLALQWGGIDYPWDSARVIALLVLFVVLFAAFIAVQVFKQDTATIPPRIFIQRTIASGACYCMCVGGIMLAFGYYLAIWFQAIQGVNALESGIRSLPFILSLVVASIFAGMFITNLGYYTPLVILSACLMAIGAGLLTTLRVNSGKPMWFGFQVIAGFGMGLGMQQPSLAAQVVLAADDVAIGASLMFFAQSFGGAIFVCAAQNVFVNKLEIGRAHV